MASSILRPALLRQTALATASRRAPSTLLTQCVQRPAAKDAVRVAAFHASSRRAILPAGPQVIKGTVNDPAPVPHSDPTHGSYHWTFDRIIAAGIVPLSLAPFAAGSLNPVTDAILCSLLLIHSHTGFAAIILDYIPKKRFPTARFLFDWALRAATVLVGIGLYEFETNDVGITETLRRVWKA